MKNLYEKWNSVNLVLRILCGMIIGIFLALVIPQASGIALIGSMFVGALKAIAPLLVFVIVISSLANAKQGHKSNMGTVIMLYMVSTILGAVVAVLGSTLFPVTLTLSGVSEDIEAAPQGVAEVFSNLLSNVVANPIASIANANYIGILFWAVIFGVLLKKSAPSTKKFLSDIADAASDAVRVVISFAPFGILGLVFEAISSSGIEIFMDYGRLILLIVGCMLFQEFVTNGILVGLSIRQNPYPLIMKCARESGLTAFFTRSSAANIPVNMELCKKLGLDEDNYSVSIPLGSTINMDGAAITITVMTLAACHTVGISATLPASILLSIIATVSACGTSGVAGGSLLLIPLACSLFGISEDVSAQIVGIGFIISVIQDSCETALNSSSDVLLTATAEFSEWKKQGKKLPL
ncbi:MAG: serine/threonine transporter SstT [Oscillospiraceae bacterium]|nr:serine/threonine transporter SstT [Oscillospiraceae bacterium]